MAKKLIKAVIIDDEKHAVATLAWKIERFCPEIKVVQQFTDPSEAMEYLRQDPPELVFLDIEMPRLNGFEIIDELGVPLSFEVIFTTAYDEFGIRAIKVNALDYLLKPIQVQDLKTAIEKYKNRKITTNYTVLFSNNEDPPVSIGKIALATKEDVEFIEPEHIIYCASDSNYTIVHLSDNRKKLISRTLKDIETLLKPHRFFRIHASYLINLQHIKKYVKTDGGYLIMSNNERLPVSRSRKEDLLKLF